MHRGLRTRLWGAVLLVIGVVTAAAARSDAVSAVAVLRAGGCGGILPAAPPLHRNGLLDQVAAQWAGGQSLAAAAEASGYRAAVPAGVHLRAEEAALLQVMRRSACTTVMTRDLREVGLYRSGLDSWLVIAPTAPQRGVARVPVAAPSVPSGSTARAAIEPDAAPALAARALQLINDVRSRGARCGEHSFAPAPPVTLSGTLAGVAFGHAADMAEHGYFEHEDLAGQSPADRVRAVGYREKLVGENIAYGPQTVEEVVQGWLDSPDHCENIMDPRFAEMGIGYAAGRTSRRGLYWVQLLAEPRA